MRLPARPGSVRPGPGRPGPPQRPARLAGAVGRPLEPDADLKHRLHRRLAVTALAFGLPVVIILWVLEAVGPAPRAPMLGLYAVMALLCVWAAYRVASGQSLDGSLRLTVLFNALFVPFQAYYGAAGGEVSFNMYLMLITNAIFAYLVFDTRRAGWLNLGMFGVAVGAVLLRAAQGAPTLTFFILQLFLSTLIVLVLLHGLAWYKSRFVVQAHERLRLEHEVCTDALTGLPNRRRLYQQIEALLHPAHPDAGGSVIMLDIDHFKAVNDMYGHPAGDSALAHVAGLLRQEANAGAGATPGRWGGEEFMLILPGVTETGAVRRAEALRQRLRDSPHPQVGPLTASFGVSLCRADDDLTSLVARVDGALYRAKAGGRDRIETAGHLAPGRWGDATTQVE